MRLRKREPRRGGGRAYRLDGRGRIAKLQRRRSESRFLLALRLRHLVRRRRRVVLVSRHELRHFHLELRALGLEPVSLLAPRPLGGIHLPPGLPLLLLQRLLSGLGLRGGDHQPLLVRRPRRRLRRRPGGPGGALRLRQLRQRLRRRAGRSPGLQLAVHAGRSGRAARGLPAARRLAPQQRRLDAPQLLGGVSHALRRRRRLSLLQRELRGRRRRRGRPVRGPRRGRAVVQQRFPSGRQRRRLRHLRPRPRQVVRARHAAPRVLRRQRSRESRSRSRQRPPAPARSLLLLRRVGASHGAGLVGPHVRRAGAAGVGIPKA